MLNTKLNGNDNKAVSNLLRPMRAKNDCAEVSSELGAGIPPRPSDPVLDVAIWSSEFSDKNSRKETVNYNMQSIRA